MALSHSRQTASEQTNLKFLDFNILLACFVAPYSVGLSGSWVSTHGLFLRFLNICSVSRAQNRGHCRCVYIEQSPRVWTICVRSLSRTALSAIPSPTNTIMISLHRWIRKSPRQTHTKKQTQGHIEEMNTKKREETVQMDISSVVDTPPPPRASRPTIVQCRSMGPRNSITPNPSKATDTPLCTTVRVDE
jgi:hypothetical protein